PCAGASGTRRATGGDGGEPRADRGGALGPHAGRATSRVLGHLVDLGPAGGSSRQAAADDRERAIRLWDAVAAAIGADAASESRSAARRCSFGDTRRCGVDLPGGATMTPLMTAPMTHGDSARRQT